MWPFKKKSQAKWLTYCGMTCLGGSEQRECSCEGPLKCELRDHPDFLQNRRKATKRMRRGLSLQNKK